MIRAIAFSLALLCYACAPSRPGEQGDAARAEEPAITIAYIAHASFLLSSGEDTLLLDPYADTTWISYFFPRAISADAIVSTHPHYDHDGGIFRDLKPYWEGSMPFYQDPGEYTFGEFRVTGIKGRHCDPYGKEFGQKNTIFLFDVAGIRFCHWGDNGTINDTIAPYLTDIDVLFLPIDDTYHILKAEEIAETIEALNPKIIVPMHYRITELEPTPGKPKNLGPIDAYIAARDNVTQLDTNVFTLTREDLPDEQMYLVFRHSDAVKN